MNQYTVFLGNFGSGKSELAINMALKQADAGQSVMLVDLDVINPYFRVSERYELLQAAGVRLVGPTYALQKIEIMSLPAEIYAAFSHQGHVIFDLGGDQVGSLAAGQYKPYFDRLTNLSVLFVLNPMRPMASTLERCLALMQGIERNSRLRISGIVNNANLLDQTTGEHLLKGYALARELSLKTGVCVWGTFGLKAPIEAFLATPGLDMTYVGAVHQIDINMHRDWDSYLKKGL